MLEQVCGWALLCACSLSAMKVEMIFLVWLKHSLVDLWMSSFEMAEDFLRS